MARDVRNDSPPRPGEDGAPTTFGPYWRWLIRRNQAKKTGGGGGDTTRAREQRARDENKAAAIKAHKVGKRRRGGASIATEGLG